MRKQVLTVLILMLSLVVVAQQQKKGTLLNDKFKGNISVGGDDAATTSLTLQHEPYADMGTFTLTEFYRATQFEKATTNVTTGEWTVLKGSAKDENATVVELDANHKRMLYFLRLKDGNLQQLDVSLHEIPPASKHILRKQ